MKCANSSTCPWLVALLIFSVFWVAVPASAFQMNPCMRVLTLTAQGPSQEAARIFNACGIVPQLQLTVHEHLTLETLREYGAPVHWSENAANVGTDRRFNYTDAPVWTLNGRQAEWTFNIMKGIWWNDDPEMYLWGEGWDFIFGLYKIKKMFDNKSDSYSSGGSNRPVLAAVHLGHQSHYGNLQHLHFMFQPVEPEKQNRKLEDTTEKALKWMEFAYSVATGVLPADAAFGKLDESELGLPSIARNFDVEPVNVKVRTLFARVGAGTEEDRNRITPGVALGSMLHVLQDSFSPAHTCRVAKTINGRTIGALADVYDYGVQDHDDHADLDVYPKWLTPIFDRQEHVYANDPVVVGAWLIGAVDKALPWSEVQAHLLATAFARTSEPAPVEPAACIH